MSDRPTGSAKQRAKTKTEQMRAERAAAAARQKRNQRILWGIGGLVIVGLVAAIAFVVVNAAGGDGDDRPSVTEGELVAPSGLVDGAVPVGEPDAPVTVDLYFDYMCPACGAFEATNGEDLGALIDDGTVKVNLRVMNFLDDLSEGTEYSTRAGNALATVADQAREAVWDFHDALYANQPAERTEGLSDAEIAEIAVEAGVPQDVADSFSEGTYGPWVAQSNDAAFDDGIESTPTIMIDGEVFEDDWSQPGALTDAIEAAAGAE